MDDASGPNQPAGMATCGKKWRECHSGESGRLAWPSGQAQIATPEDYMPVSSPCQAEIQGKTEVGKMGKLGTLNADPAIACSLRPFCLSE